MIVPIIWTAPYLIYSRNSSTLRSRSKKLGTWFLRQSKTHIQQIDRKRRRRLWNMRMGTTTRTTRTTWTTWVTRIRTKCAIKINMVFRWPRIKHRKSKAIIWVLWAFTIKASLMMDCLLAEPSSPSNRKTSKILMMFRSLQSIMI